MAPATDQSGGEVLQVRELDLQLALVAFGSGGKNFQNQERAIRDRDTEVPLQVTLLGRGKGLVEYNPISLATLNQHLDFVSLS